MGTKILFENFEEIYNRTYKHILKYIISHCNNLDDVNDIIQETYIEFYKKLKKSKKIELEDEQAFIIGVSKNILKKYYRSKYKHKNNVVNFEDENVQIDSNIDIELNFITKENVAEIWQILKNKDIKIAKIFYLHYGMDMKITDIAKELNLTESATKNYIYRTIKELKKESDENARK
ncbi:MAG: sigma-70 family RNA polymerase sigma factor [Clostridia bacterium]|nr:sigma-70 family RNA polymerase sigma factor [Clostridia bacterium]